MEHHVIFILNQMTLNQMTHSMRFCATNI